MNATVASTAPHTAMPRVMVSTLEELTANRVFLQREGDIAPPAAPPNESGLVRILQPSRSDFFL